MDEAEKQESRVIRITPIKFEEKSTEVLNHLRSAIELVPKPTAFKVPKIASYSMSAEEQKRIRSAILLSGARRPPKRCFLHPILEQDVHGRKTRIPKRKSC